MSYHTIEQSITQGQRIKKSSPTETGRVKTRALRDNGVKKIGLATKWYDIIEPVLGPIITSRGMRSTVREVVGVKREKRYALPPLVWKLNTDSENLTDPDTKVF